MEDNYDELAQQLLMEQEYYEEIVRITMEALNELTNENYYNEDNDLPF